MLSPVAEPFISASQSLIITCCKSQRILLKNHFRNGIVLWYNNWIKPKIFPNMKIIYSRPSALFAALVAAFLAVVLAAADRSEAASDYNAYWSMDSNTVSGSNIDDLAPGDHDLTAHNGAASATGMFGEAFRFDGGNDYPLCCRCLCTGADRRHDHRFLDEP